MGFFGSRAILEVVSQKLNLRLSVLKRGEHGYERKREKKREKRKERREKGKKTVEQVCEVSFSPPSSSSSDLQVVAREKSQGKLKKQVSF